MEKFKIGRYFLLFLLISSVRASNRSKDEANRKPYRGKIVLSFAVSKSSPENLIFRRKFIKKENIEVHDIELYVNTTTNNCSLYFTPKTKSSVYRLETTKTLFSLNLKFLINGAKKQEQWNYKTPCYALLPNTEDRKKILKFNPEKTLKQLSQVEMDLEIIKNPTKENYSKALLINSGVPTFIHKRLLNNEKAAFFIQEHRKGVSMALVLLSIFFSFQTIWYVAKKTNCFKKNQPELASSKTLAKGKK